MAWRSDYRQWPSRNPKYQGLVEQGNGTVEKMLGVRLLESDANVPPWSEWLAFVLCKFVLVLF